ncbi:MAG: polymer-forming cytoskeletal protein [Proteobacteria bacterium]|nr:polymer-forming cytoskeletal protein [Pseudomonadota bacterium]
MINIAPGGSGDGEEKVTTVIADDLEIQGTMKFKNSLMIKGILEGEIISEGLLIVGPTAKVAAKITTKDLISHGEIQGDVTASDRVMLKSTSSHNGNITTPYIVIESGSIFNGSCIMKREEPVQIADVVFTEAMVEKETVSEEEITEETEMQITEEQITEEQITEEQITEEQITEEQITEEQITETVWSTTEEQITEEQITEEQITEEQITEEQITETVWSTEDEYSVPKPPKAELF